MDSNLIGVDPRSGSLGAENSGVDISRPLNTDVFTELHLAFLYEHCVEPKFTCRFHWKRGSVALWDNRCTQHYALDDYREFERVMYRVTIGGTGHA